MALNNEDLKKIKEIQEEGIDQFALIVAKGFEGQQKYMDGRFGDLEGRMGSLEGRMGSLEGRMGSLEGRMETGFRHVNARLDIIERDVAILRQQYSSLQSDNRLIRKDVSRIHLEIREIRKQIKNLPSRDEYEAHEHRLHKIELEFNLIQPK